MKKLTLIIKSAELLLTSGMDEIFLHLDNLPSPFPNQNTGATAQINTQKGLGEQWCIDNLGITPKIHDARPKVDNREQEKPVETVSENPHNL